MNIFFPIAHSRRRLDPNAAAYLAAITAAGVTPTTDNVAVVSQFYKAEKVGLRYESHRRLYLPIWGIAAANAICLKSLTSGTFVGGVTHGAGFVQANDTSSGFNFGVGLTSIGAGIGNAHIFTLISQEADWTGSPHEIMYAGSGVVFARISSSVSTNFRLRMFSANFFQTVTGRNGVVSLSETSTTERRSAVRKTAGSQSVTDSSTSSGSYSGGILAMYAGFAETGSNARLGAYGAGQSLPSAAQDAFTLNLKFLWENLTGRTLP